MASWDEARLCPKCKQPGKEINRMPDGAGGQVVVLECANPADQIWGPYMEGERQMPGERYVVQVRSDGTIPDPEANPDKAFPAQANAVFGRDSDFEKVRDAMRAQQEQMSRPEGGETSR